MPNSNNNSLRRKKKNRKSKKTTDNKSSIPSSSSCRKDESTVEILENVSSALRDISESDIDSPSLVEVNLEEVFGETVHEEEVNCESSPPPLPEDTPAREMDTESAGEHIMCGSSTAAGTQRAVSRARPRPPAELNTEATGNTSAQPAPAAVQCRARAGEPGDGDCDEHSPAPPSAPPGTAVPAPAPARERAEPRAGAAAPPSAPPGTAVPAPAPARERAEPRAGAAAPPSAPPGTAVPAPAPARERAEPRAGAAAPPSAPPGTAVPAPAPARERAEPRAGAAAPPSAPPGTAVPAPAPARERAEPRAGAAAPPSAPPGTAVPAPAPARERAEPRAGAATPPSAPPGTAAPAPARERAEPRAGAAAPPCTAPPAAASSLTLAPRIYWLGPLPRRPFTHQECKKSSLCEPQKDDHEISKTKSGDSFIQSTGHDLEAQETVSSVRKSSDCKTIWSHMLTPSQKNKAEKRAYQIDSNISQKPDYINKETIEEVKIKPNTRPAATTKSQVIPNVSTCLDEEKVKSNHETTLVEDCADVESFIFTKKAAQHSTKTKLDENTGSIIKTTAEYFKQLAGIGKVATTKSQEIAKVSTCVDEEKLKRNHETMFKDCADVERCTAIKKIEPHSKKDKPDENIGSILETTTEYLKMQAGKTTSTKSLETAKVSTYLDDEKLKSHHSIMLKDRADVERCSATKKVEQHPTKDKLDDNTGSIVETTTEYRKMLADKTASFKSQDIAVVSTGVDEEHEVSIKKPVNVYDKIVDISYIECFFEYIEHHCNGNILSMYVERNVIVKIGEPWMHILIEIVDHIFLKTNDINDLRAISSAVIKIARGELPLALVVKLTALWARRQQHNLFNT